jgi:NAD(P)-dependent dehydrogenase (short-subunit alcohol dehydrogenase family)
MTTPVRPPSDRFDLTGKVALVTGGSRGLGREMVLAFAAAGADVVITSRNLESCQALAAEVTERTGRAALPHGCHVGHWDELDGLVDAAYDRFGHVDVLVNNAGMSLLYDEPTDVTEKMWDNVVNLNLKGPFRLTSLVGTRMVGHGGGSIINVSSTGSIRPTPNILPYAAAKSGLNALTGGFAKAFGPSVRVNCLMAGPFFTDISKAWDLERVEEGVRSHALRRGGQPEEIVGAALFLASDASSFTTGAVLRADGGIP